MLRPAEVLPGFLWSYHREPDPPGVEDLAVVHRAAPQTPDPTATIPTTQFSHSPARAGVWAGLGRLALIGPVWAGLGRFGPVGPVLGSGGAVGGGGGGGCWCSGGMWRNPTGGNISKRDDLTSRVAQLSVSLFSSTLIQLCSFFIWKEKLEKVRPCSPQNCKHTRLPHLGSS